jgi:hypothetical protein
VADGVYFCPTCGASVETSPSELPSQSVPVPPTDPRRSSSRAGAALAWWHRRSKRTQWVLATVVILLAIGAVGAALEDPESSGGQASGETSEATMTSSDKVASVTDSEGFTCATNEAKYGRCPRNPFFGMTRAEARTAKAARAREAARKRAQERVEHERQALADWASGVYEWSTSMGSASQDIAQGAELFDFDLIRSGLATFRACADLLPAAPPGSIPRAIHRDLLSACRRYDRAASLMSQGLDDFDSSLILSATQEMTAGTAIVAAANTKIQRLVP